MRSPVAAWLAFVLGCGPADVAWDGAVRDSAGIRIIENGGKPIWRTGEGWGVVPGLETIDGPGSGDDLGIVGGLALDGHGRIIVLDLLARQLVAFDSVGRFLRTIGEPGTGPGGLGRFVTSVLTRNDSIFVPDWGQARVNVFEPSGEFAQQIAMPPEPQAQSWAVKPDGAFLFRGITIGRDTNGRYTTWDALLTADAGLAHFDTLIDFEYPRSDLGGPSNSLVPLIVNVPFWTVLEDGRIAWSSLDRTEVMIHSPDGRWTGLLRNAAWSHRPLTAADREVLEHKIRDRYQTLVGNPAIVDDFHLVYDETLPAITGLLAGPDGTLWVQRMGDVASIDPIGINTNDHSWALGGTAWDVFDRDGRLLGTIALPHRLRAVRIDGESIWGVRKDQDDVETVVRVDLARPRR